MKQTSIAIILAAALTATAVPATEPTALALQQRGFFHGREYFMVRSGRVQWIVQVDRADLGPAVTGYLFDADYVARNSKHQAYNYIDHDGVRSSSLAVVPQKSNFGFTAFGEHTRARWVQDEGIPSVEATWWADGVRVTERFAGLSENNTVRRTISLTGANLHGEERYSLRLRLPAGKATAAGRALSGSCNTCPQALVVGGGQPVRLDAAQGMIEIGPLTISPGQTVTVETYLLAQIPADTKTAEDFRRQIARAANDAGGLVRTTREHWARASSLGTDDTLVQEVFDNTRSILPAIVSDAGKFRPGLFQYPVEWVRDDSQYSLGLTASGQFELARAVLEHCLRDMLTPQGTTMIGGRFDDPDREQFDQAGELLLALRWYVDFSGDTSLVTKYRDRLIAMTERPLNPRFRDASGLVHNRREFWEQTMKDAYELAYNTYVIVGLREAAALADPLRAEDRKATWLKEADALQAAMLKTLVHGGVLIKRRNVTGEIAEHLVNPGGASDVPSMNVNHHRIHPDATMALPMALGLVTPHSALADNTLNEVEKLRNLRWSGGGYDRYDSSCEINTPGPWGIAGALILRGQHAAGQLDRSRHTLEWFRNVQGGNAGLYYEEIPLIAGSQQNWIGLVPWPSGELQFFLVHHYLGMAFENETIVIRPQLYPGSPAVKADLRFRKGRLKLEIPGPGPYTAAGVNGLRIIADQNGAFRLPPGFAGGTVVFQR